MFQVILVKRKKTLTNKSKKKRCIFDIIRLCITAKKPEFNNPERNNEKNFILILLFNTLLNTSMETWEETINFKRRSINNRCKPTKKVRCWINWTGSL
jgi:hypothetical protein